MEFIMGNDNYNNSESRSSKEDLESNISKSSSRKENKFFTAPPNRPPKNTLLKKTIYSLAMVSALIGFGFLQSMKNSDVGKNVPAREISSIKELSLTKSDLNSKITDQVRQMLNKGEVPDILNGASPEIIEKVKNGQMSFYSIRMVDTLAQDGDVVKVSINGLPAGMITLSHAGAYISLPLFPGQLNSLQIQAIEDGGGGVTFGAYSSTGQVYSKIMKVGDFETWQIGGI